MNDVQAMKLVRARDLERVPPEPPITIATVGFEPAGRFGRGQPFFADASVYADEDLSETILEEAGLHGCMPVEDPDGGLLSTAKGRKQLAECLCGSESFFQVHTLDKRSKLAESLTFFIYDALFSGRHRVLDEVDFLGHVAGLLHAAMIRSRTPPDVIAHQAAAFMDTFDPRRLPSVFGDLQTDRRLCHVLAYVAATTRRGEIPCRGDFWAYHDPLMLDYCLTVEALRRHPDAWRDDHGECRVEIVESASISVLHSLAARHDLGFSTIAVAEPTCALQLARLYAAVAVARPSLDPRERAVARLTKCLARRGDSLAWRTSNPPSVDIWESLAADIVLQEVSERAGQSHRRAPRLHGVIRLAKVTPLSG